MNKKISIFWFRRDLRLDDNHALYEALNGHFPVLPIFIFDTDITNELVVSDPRITFIYDQIHSLSSHLKNFFSSIYCLKGAPLKIWKNLLNDFDIQSVYANEDYEPYAIKRDREIQQLLAIHNIELNLLKDQAIFAKKQILKSDKTPYTVFTPYKNIWLNNFRSETQLRDYTTDKHNFFPNNFSLPSLSELGFRRSSVKVLSYTLSYLDKYEKAKDFPALNQTSYLSPHLRFGTISIRKIIKKTSKNQTFFNELIWREFFMQILYNFPHVVHSNFKRKYDSIQWRNNPEEFEKWKNGETGYPMVDAGMRELKATGYMHNRVRMVVAGFLCKHLLIDWRWGEAYFAQKLLDYELSSNNGNWQWSAGTGCDSAPYFRVFNPTEQIKKFDPKMEYIRKWIPELNSLDYPLPIVEHKFARERAIATYKSGLKQTL